MNLLVDDPSLPIEEVRQAALNSSMDLWDEVTRTMVPAADVAKVLAAMTPPLRVPHEVVTYHATSPAFARELLLRGFLPETKARARSEGLGASYAPGRGLDRGLYVGATPEAVEGYGRVVLEVAAPRRSLAVPTELAQLGETDPMRALRSHDGAVIRDRLPASSFRRVRG